MTLHVCRQCAIKCNIFHLCIAIHGVCSNVCLGRALALLVQSPSTSIIEYKYCLTSPGGAACMATQDGHRQVLRAAQHRRHGLRPGVRGTAPQRSHAHEDRTAVSYTLRHEHSSKLHYQI
jgi:hypothetical protein